MLARYFKTNFMILIFVLITEVHDSELLNLLILSGFQYWKSEIITGFEFITIQNIEFIFVEWRKDIKGIFSFKNENTK